MAHANKARSFGRSHDQKAALMKSLMRSLVIHERIMTTEAKARELRPMIEKMITRAKTDTVANRRLVASRIGDAIAVKKLFTTLGPRFKGRAGGYTRIVKRPMGPTGRRNAYIAFVD